MNINIQIPEKIELDNTILQKMIFLYNALNNGWNIKKNNNKYIFFKNSEEKEEVYLDSYLSYFLETHIGIQNTSKI